MKYFEIGEYLAKLHEECGCLVHFARLDNTLLKDEEGARDNHVLACNLPNIYRFRNHFTDRLSNKPFLILLLTTSPTLNM